MVMRDRQTILCTWEIGGELGHISRLSAIAKALDKAGYRVVVALKDLSRAYPFFAETEVVLVQAPVWLPKISMQRPIACQPDSMLLLGYLEPDPLECLMLAWRALAELVQPDLVVFDFSPTAMLALREYPIPKLLVGTGFAEPVPGRPMADWRPIPVKDGLVERQEKRVLGVINRVLQRRGEPLLPCLSEMFRADRTFISNFREFDIYPEREGAIYCLGPGMTRDEVSVPSTGRPRLVAYLKPAHPQYSLLIRALARCKADVLVVSPQGSRAELLKVAGPHFRFETDVIDLPAALSGADLFIGHGNAGSTRESLVAGVPVVVLPIQLEQLLTGRKVQALNLGRLFEQVSGEDELVAQLNDALIQRAVFRESVVGLLSRYPQPYIGIHQAVLAACRDLLTAKA